MVERVHFSRKTKSKAKSMTVPPTSWRGFSEPLLLEGEDETLYCELHARLHAAVQPVGIIEEMLVDDVASLEWEVLRWRRLKTSFIRARRLEALEAFLQKNLELGTYRDIFVPRLTRILEEKFSEDAEPMALMCLLNRPEAVHKINKLLEINKILEGYGYAPGSGVSSLRDDARREKAKELVQEYMRRDPDALALVDDLLEGAGTSMDGIIADAVAENIEAIERFDRLTTLAEGRRNASLREIDRHRLVLGASVRQTVQQIEEGEFAVIEAAPGKGNKAA